ncbi:TPA: hypothetical protein HNO22_24320 [Escherichia coli]|nr:hypothetical protein [Escherichia coli]
MISLQLFILPLMLLFFKCPCNEVESPLIQSYRTAAGWRRRRTTGGGRRQRQPARSGAPALTSESDVLQAGRKTPVL